MKDLYMYSVFISIYILYIFKGVNKNREWGMMSDEKSKKSNYFSSRVRNMFFVGNKSNVKRNVFYCW